MISQKRKRSILFLYTIEWILISRIFSQFFADFYGKKRYILISSLSISTSGLYYMEHPFALILDPIFGAIFWTDIGTDNPKIERARLDGSDRKIIINSEIKSPKGISLDSKRRKIYWCDTALNSLFSAGNVLISRKKIFFW